MTRAEVIKEINDTQDFYVSKLIDEIKRNESLSNEARAGFKELNFTSPTGTGKTIMMAKLISLLPDYYFVVTTLSKGQLKYQIADSLKRNVNGKNFKVYGLNDFTLNTRKQANDFIAEFPKRKPIIWIRDEGHIKTNRWASIVSDRAVVTINFSATNKEMQGIQCNFSHTMMLRTPIQALGTPEKAIERLLEVKEDHRRVDGYNPCALFRIMDDSATDEILKLCKKYNLKCKNITEESFDMSKLCRDDNEIDVIINKFKIVEGIDLKRCHVIYIDNKPSNEATVVQIIGRARRNALLWREDIDLFTKENHDLLLKTRECYIYYNIAGARVRQNDDGELSYALCDKISVEKLKPNTKIYVEDGKLLNGLSVLELEGQTGWYNITKDDRYNCNVVDNPDFYKDEYIRENPFSIDLTRDPYQIKRIIFKPTIAKLFMENCSYTVDQFKLHYLYYERALDKKKIEFNKEKCRSILGIGNLDYKPSYKDYFKAKLIIRESYPKLEELYSASFEGMLIGYDEKLYSNRAEDDASVIDTKIDIVSRVRMSDYRLSKEILPYIEAVEVVDLKPFERLNEIQAKYRIRKDGVGIYTIPKYPSTKLLREKYNIRSIRELRAKVATIEGSFCGRSKEEWEEILNSMWTFRNLDYIGLEYVKIDDLNERYKLGLTSEQIRNIKMGKLPTIESKDFENIQLLSSYSGDTNYENSIVASININSSIFTMPYCSYTKKINSRETAIIGAEDFRVSEAGFLEDSAITSKINTYSKFNNFIINRYSKYIALAEEYLFNGKNSVKLDSRLNSCLGYCSEYYAKYLLYGKLYLNNYINVALVEHGSTVITTEIIIRACILMYKQDMIMTYGYGVSMLIKGIAVERLFEEKYKEFVRLVVELGTNIAKFVDSKMHIKESIRQNKLLNSPNLSINHLTALCDFVNEDTIIDIRCTGSIKRENVYQILSYHYLSTKRSDLKIKHLYIYDAVSQRSLQIEIDDELNELRD